MRSDKTLYPCLFFSKYILRKARVKFYFSSTGQILFINLRRLRQDNGKVLYQNLNHRVIVLFRPPVSSALSFLSPQLNKIKAFSSNCYSTMVRENVKYSQTFYANFLPFWIFSRHVISRTAPDA